MSEEREPSGYPQGAARVEAIERILKSASLTLGKESYDELWEGLEVVGVSRDVVSAVTQPKAAVREALAMTVKGLQSVLARGGNSDLRSRMGGHWAAIENACTHANQELVAINASMESKRSGLFKGVGDISATPKALAVLYELTFKTTPTAITDETFVDADGNGDTRIYGPFVDFVRAVQAEFGWPISTPDQIKTALYSD